MKVNWRKFGLRLVQGALIVAIVVSIGRIIGYIYDTNHYTYAIFTIVFGSFALVLVVELISAINKRINEDKEED